MLDIYIDADACPVKDEIYRVAARYQLRVFVVANGWLRTPESPLVQRITVTEGLDQADDWIVTHAGTGDIVVTTDSRSPTAASRLLLASSPPPAAPSPPTRSAPTSPPAT
jgi:uncharacterized protein YaiI (UPF0178 family)